MTRHAPALLALSIIAVAGWTYNVNYDTRAALDRLTGLRAEIADEREALQVLRVEWAYLNAPDRLAGLVAAHNGALGLVPLMPEALGIAAAIPYPPRETPAVPPASEALVASASPGIAEPSPDAPPAPATERATAPGPATVTLAALSGPNRMTAAPLPAADVPDGVETVPAGLEAAIAAALVEVGVPMEAETGRGGPRAGVVAVAAHSSAGVFAAASAGSGVPLPAARPVAWSQR